jgi:hypothetical protein
MLLRLGQVYVSLYSIGLHGSGECFSSREAVSPIKTIIWKEELLMGVEMSLRVEPHLYVFFLLLFLVE